MMRVTLLNEHFWMMLTLWSKKIRPMHSELLTKLSSRFWKFHFFTKNFRTLTAKHFQNFPIQKVRKIPSNAGPYKNTLFKQTCYGKISRTHVWLCVKYQNRKKETTKHLETFFFEKGKNVRKIQSSIDTQDSNILQKQYADG